MLDSDESKFGQKMLEKFGWSKGKGLGANEDGNVDHVKISVKNDTRGVGCSKNHADNWIAHQDDFNDLLSSLNQDTTENNDEDTTDKVTGLESKSKASRSRVHYQKFTKGKDLSSKSQEDMACIFGRRQVKPDTDFSSSSEDDGSSSDTQNKAEHGVITVRSTDSVQDYFAKKMAEKKASMTSLNGISQSSDEERPSFCTDIKTVDNETDEKRSSEKKKVRFSLGEDDISDEKSKAKKKKSKKKKNNEENVVDTMDTTTDSSQENSADGCGLKCENARPENKRKRKSEEVQVEVVKSKKLKKKKKEKCSNNIASEISVETDELKSNSVENSNQIKCVSQNSKEESKVADEDKDNVKPKKAKKSKKKIGVDISAGEESSVFTVKTDSGDSEFITGEKCQQLNVLESMEVKRETPLSDQIIIKLKKNEKSRKKYVLRRKLRDQQAPKESKKDRTLSSSGAKKRQNRSDTQTPTTPGGYLGHHTNPSDFKLNHKSEQVMAEVKKYAQAFPGSNCIEVTGYGKDSDVVLANKILEKKKKKAKKDQLKAKTKAKKVQLKANKKAKKDQLTANQKQQWSNIQKKNSKKLIRQKQNVIHVYV